MPKKVIVASESVFRRNLLSEIISAHKDITVVGLVRNGQEALEIIEKKDPDVLIVDIEYKSKDWLLSFNNITQEYIFPIIVLTDIDPKTLDPSEIPTILNSYDYVVKPSGIWREVLPQIKDILLFKLLKIHIKNEEYTNFKARLKSNQKSIQKRQQIISKPEIHSKNHGKVIFEHRSEEYFLDLSPITLKEVPTKIIVIGASVGGPRTLRMILSEIPHNFSAPILVVQHLNHLFMRQLVMSLKSVCKINVKIGINYEEIKPGIIYFSPGDKHMQVTVKNDKPYIRTFEGEPVNFCRPSVDVLFYSTARVYKNNTLGILLTGMGRDGVEGLRAIKEKGGKTIAESEETSVLYGMPKAAAETGAADFIMPSYQICNEIIRFIS